MEECQRCNFPLGDGPFTSCLGCDDSKICLCCGADEGLCKSCFERSLVRTCRKCHAETADWTYCQACNCSYCAKSCFLDKSHNCSTFKKCAFCPFIVPCKVCSFCKSSFCTVCTPTHTCICRCGRPAYMMCCDAPFCSTCFVDHKQGCIV